MSSSHSDGLERLAVSLTVLVLEITFFLLLVGLFLLVRALHLIIMTFVKYPRNKALWFAFGGVCIGVLVAGIGYAWVLPMTLQLMFDELLGLSLIILFTTAWVVNTYYNQWCLPPGEPILTQVLGKN